MRQFVIFFRAHCVPTVLLNWECADALQWFAVKAWIRRHQESYPTGDEFAMLLDSCVALTSEMAEAYVRHAGYGETAV